MDKTDKVVIAALGLLSALGFYALFTGPVRAQDARVTIPDRPCFKVEDVDLSGVAVTPVMRDRAGFSWIVLRDKHGNRPDTLAFTVKRDGEDLICQVAQGEQFNG